MSTIEVAEVLFFLRRSGLYQGPAMCCVFDKAIWIVVPKRVHCTSILPNPACDHASFYPRLFS